MTLSRPKGESNGEHKADLHTGGVLSTRPRKKAFTRTSTSDNVLRYTVGGSVNQPLADLITSHTFSQPDAHTIGITLTAQTRNVDPKTGQKRQYTLTETVLRRN